MMRVANSPSWLDVKLKPWWIHTHTQHLRQTRVTATSVIEMRDRSQNRKPLQRGRNLSIEAIQAVQSLKRAHLHNNSVEQVFSSKFRRLLKFDMIAVLRELLRQNQCLLALMVFEDIRREHWYKPQILLYSEMIQVFGSNGLFEHVDIVYMYLKKEKKLEPQLEGFNAILNSLVTFELRELVIDCYELMRRVSCEPDRSSFRILVSGLESMGEMGSAGVVRQDALKYYGDLEFLEDNEENVAEKN